MHISIGNVVQVIQNVYKIGRIETYNFTATVEDIDNAGVLQLIVHDGRHGSKDETRRSALLEDVVAVIP